MAPQIPAGSAKRQKSLRWQRLERLNTPSPIVPLADDLDELTSAAPEAIEPPLAPPSLPELDLEGVEIPEDVGIDADTAVEAIDPSEVSEAAPTSSEGDLDGGDSAPEPSKTAEVAIEPEAIEAPALPTLDDADIEGEVIDFVPVASEPAIEEVAIDPADSSTDVAPVVEPSAIATATADELMLMTATDATDATEPEAIGEDDTDTDTEDLLQPISLPEPDPLFKSGIFTVGASGQVAIDVLWDGGQYQGQAGIFSLSGLETYELGSADFIAEVARRVTSNSVLGHLIWDDTTEAARFSGEMGGETDFNTGSYAGVKTFQMTAGDTFGVVLAPDATFGQLLSQPGAGGSWRPLFSMAAANPADGFQMGQIADVTGDGNTFTFEDLRVDRGGDKDYNDFVFQVRGATGEAVLMDEVVAPGKDWRNTDAGQLLVSYAEQYVEAPIEGAISPVPDGFAGDDGLLPAPTDDLPLDFEPSAGEELPNPADGVLPGVASDLPGPLPTYTETRFEFAPENQPVIGIIDTGFAGNNPDFKFNNITWGKDYVSGDLDPTLAAGEGSQHGTHILGVIAAQQDNGVGIDGINPDAPIFATRAIGNGAWAEALTDTVDHIKASGQPNGVVNLSLDLTQRNPDGSITTRYEFTPEERGAIEYARQNGVVLVVAAGNDGGVMSVLGQASQEFDNIVTVGAVERTNGDTSLYLGSNRVDYASYGDGLTVVADGGTPENPVLSTVDDGVGTMAGTSVATARVTGAVSQIWAANPELSYRQVIDILKQTATDLGATGWDAQTGAGLVNLAAAISLARMTVGEGKIDPEDFLTPTTWGGEGAVDPTERAVATEYGNYNPSVSSEFLSKVRSVAQNLGLAPEYLMAVMGFETGGTYSPSIRNSQSGATGLIQFMPSTAVGLGTSTNALARMTAIQQMDYVEKYFSPYKNRLSTLEDTYMAVLWPAAIGRGSNHVLFRSGTIEYTQNSGLDLNRNGVVTAAEATSKTRAYLPPASLFGNASSTPSPGSSTPTTVAIPESWSMSSSAKGVGQIAVGRNQDGRLEAFVVGPDNRVYQSWQITPGGNWSNWQQLSGGIAKSVTVARNQDGRLSVFAIGTDNRAYHISQVAPNSNWTSWQQLPGGITAKDLTVGQNADGRLEVFAIGTDDKVYQAFQTSPNGNWSSWYSLAGGIAKSVTVGRNRDGRLTVVAIGTDNRVYHISQVSPNSSWGSWQQLSSGTAKEVEIGQNADGRLEVFSVGMDDRVYQAFQTSPNGNWSGWYSLSGGIAKTVTVGRNQDGRQEVFAVGMDNRVYQAWQINPNGGWSNWQPLLQSGLVSGLTASQNQDGRLEVFAMTANGQFQNAWQDRPNSGWVGWQPRTLPNSGTSPSTPARIVGFDGTNTHQTYIRTFERNGGLSALGSPSSNVGPWGGGYTQRFTGGTEGSGSIMKSNMNDLSYWVGGSFWQTLLSAGGAEGILGYPTSDRYATSGGSRQNFQGGAIIQSSNGVFPLFGGIGTHYLRNEGGETGRLGFPTSNEIGLGNGVIVQNFQRGRIVYGNGPTRTELYQAAPTPAPAPAPTPTPAPAPAPTPISHPSISTVWNSYRGTLGNPTSGITNHSSGATYQLFQNGSIVSSRHGTFPLYGAIRQSYQANSGLNGWLGAPTSAEQPQGNGVITQTFEGGYIIWNGRTATAYKNGSGSPSASIPSNPQPGSGMYGNPENFYSWAMGQTGITRLDGMYAYRGQCVTLIARYIQEVFLSESERSKSRAFGDGKDTARVVASMLPNQFSPATSVGLPKRGAVISFPGIGVVNGIRYGHVGIVMAARQLSNGQRQVQIMDSNGDGLATNSKVTSRSTWINIPDGSASGYGSGIYWTNPK
jgi:hypothetical protein